jgi:hypothetical protein
MVACRASGDGDDAVDEVAPRSGEFSRVSSGAGESLGFAPQQLPSPPVHFANRTTELSQMDDVRPPGERAPRLIVITGPGGVGKSALALRWLDTVLEQFPHGALYAVLTESTGNPVAAEDVLGEFLRALGVPADAVARDSARACDVVSVDHRTTVHRGDARRRVFGRTGQDIASGVRLLRGRGDQPAATGRSVAGGRRHGGDRTVGFRGSNRLDQEPCRRCPSCRRTCGRSGVDQPL